MDELLLKLENALFDVAECLDELRVGDESMPNPELPMLFPLYEADSKVGFDMIASYMRSRRLREV